MLPQRTHIEKIVTEEMIQIEELFVDFLNHYQVYNEENLEKEYTYHEQAY